MIFTNTALHQPVSECEPSPDNRTVSPPEDSKKKTMETDPPGGLPPHRDPHPGARSVPVPGLHYYNPSRLPTPPGPLQTGQPGAQVAGPTANDLRNLEILEKNIDQGFAMVCAQLAMLNEKHQRSQQSGTQFSQQ